MTISTELSKLKFFTASRGYVSRSEHSQENYIAVVLMLGSVSPTFAKAASCNRVK